METRFDYVIVGGGSAGCIVAAELASDPGVKVLLLESGDPAEENPETLRADGYKDAFINDRLMWDRFSVPQPGCDGRRIFLGSGRGVGGSGAINGMVYTRGAAEDYEDWPAGWKWNDVTSDFEALERRLDIHRREATEFTETCMQAAEQAGFRRKDDLNDGDLSGVLGYEWMNYAGQERRSSYVAFLADAPRTNLEVRSDAHVKRLLCDADARVTGVEYEQGGGQHVVRADREVVLCAGALETPRLLLLSGIGPGPELRAHGIPRVHDAPEVGENLHDHPNIQLFFRGRRDVDCHYPQLYGFHRARPQSELREGQSDTCYVFYPARSSFREGLMRMLPAMTLSPTLYHDTPIPQLMRHAIGGTFKSKQVRNFVARMYGIVVILGKPQSRGTVRLRSSNPKDGALLDPAYFTEPEDMQTLLAGVHLGRRIAAADPLAQWGNTELMPGRWVRSEKRLQSFIEKNVMTTYHYAGTCRMGEDERAVLDPQLRVRGVRGLRVADASAIPYTPVSAMNAPSMLIGYRAARFIRQSGKVSS